MAVKPTAWFDRRWVQRTAAALVVVVFAVLLVRTMRSASRAQGNDLGSYLLSSRALLAGTNPYETPTVFPYIYPLFLALVLVPLTAVPRVAADVVWYAVSVASLGGTLYLLVRLSTLDSGDRRPRGWLWGPAALLLVALLDPIQINLMNGQVNFQVLLLSVVFLWFLRAGRTVPAAACLAAAIALKLVPLVLTLTLLARRSFRTLALVAAMAAGFCLAPYVLIGPRLWGYYAGYLRSFLLDRARSVSHDGGIFFTLHGFVSWVSPAAGAWPWVKPACAALVVAGVFAAERHEWRPARQAPSLRSFGLWLLAILLLSPMSEVHHLSLLFPAAAPLSLTALRGRLGGKASVLLVLFWVLFWAGRLDRLGPYYFLAIVCLLASLLTWEREPASDPRPAPTPS